MPDDYRDLPAVEPVEWPARLSQTLLRHHDRCPRSAYLYAKHGGGVPSHPMDRGSAFHVFAERMILELIEHGERSLYAPQLGEDSTRAMEEVASLTASMVDEILSARPDLVVPAQEADAVRVMAYHTAIGLDVDPETVVGVERKWVLDLECGWTVSGKIDLASLPEPGGGQVDDYKTSLHVPEEEANPFQRKLYAVLLVYGQPVANRVCDGCGGSGERRAGRPDAPGATVDCLVCDGRGTVEHRLDPIGGHLRWVRGRELYPRYLRRDGSVQRIEQTWTRVELEEFRIDLERAGRQLNERVQGPDPTWKFPARSGSHCNECPAEPECPLPPKLREFAGAIHGPEHAGEVLGWATRMAARAKAATDEVKSWSKATETPVPAGDVEYGFTVTTSRRLKTGPDRRSDFDGLAAAVEGAVERGDPFDIRDWIKESKTNGWKKTPVDPAAVVPSKVAAMTDAELDKRFGANAPWNEETTR